jgi:glycyl-tRNA synthetase beta chain
LTTQNLLVELLVEELPPKALKKLGESFASLLLQSLVSQSFASPTCTVSSFASPRRLAAHLTQVSNESSPRQAVIKLMPKKIGLTQSGERSDALKKRLEKEGYAHDDLTIQLVEIEDKGVVSLALRKIEPALTLSQGLQSALEQVIAKLPIPKVMTYQLESECELPGWSSVSFVRPAHSLLALHGANIIPVQILGLRSGNLTQGHRFEAQTNPLLINHADSYVETLAQQGAVVASFAERRAQIVLQLTEAAAQVDGSFKPIEDDDLLDEVTALVERPKVMTCEFETQFLDVPQECLILTMKANQKYFPLLDATQKLTNKFLVVSNINPSDPSFVISGNERVIRPRLADAKFFFDHDRRSSLESRVTGLERVVYHNKLGTQAQRMQRVCEIAKVIGDKLQGKILSESAWQAARLAKADLLTDMVGEFPELQGIMGGYYARHDGLGEEISLAIEDHYKPRFAGDELPRNPVGLVVALADKLETLVGMFGVGNLPTGDKDPFALRRHALGVIRMLMEKKLALEINFLIESTVPIFGQYIVNPLDALSDFIWERLAGSLRDSGHANSEVDAVLALRPQKLADIPDRLKAVRAFGLLPEAQALAAANKRIGNILKKAGRVEGRIDEVLLKEPAEIALFSDMQTVLPKSNSLFEAGQFSESLQSLASLRDRVDTFFDKILVNADDAALRLNRHALLKDLHTAMNRVADLSLLAV